MEFTVINNEKVRSCKVIDIADLYQGKEHGLVYLSADGSNVKTLLSNCPKSDAFRYGPSTTDMIMRGWKPFVFQDQQIAA